MLLHIYYHIVRLVQHYQTLCVMLKEEQRYAAYLGEDNSGCSAQRFNTANTKAQHWARSCGPVNSVPFLTNPVSKIHLTVTIHSPYLPYK